MSTLARPSLRNHWPLCIILLLAAALRLWQIGESLWLDELHTAWVVSGGIAEVFERAPVGNHSPLYFLLPWGTTRLFGMSEWALRLPSLVAGLTLVGFVYALTYRVTRSMLGATTASLLACCDNNLLFYATEARPYAWVQLVAALQLVLFWDLRREPTPRRRSAFVLTTCLLFYLHYTAILVLAGEVVVYVVWSWLRTSTSAERDPGTRTFSLKALLAGVFIGMLVLPGALHLAEIGSRRGNWASFVNNTDPALAARWFFLVGYVVVPLLVLVASRPSAPRRQRPLIPDHTPAFTFVIALWFLSPVVLTWLTTVTDFARLYFIRYLMAVGIAPMLFAGICIAKVARRPMRVVAMLLVLTYAIGQGTTMKQIRHNNQVLGERQEDWMSAVAWLDSEYDMGPVFVRSGLLEADQLRSHTTPLFKQYCLCPLNSMYPFKKPGELIPLPTRSAGALNAEAIAAIQREGVAWFVINASDVSHGRIVRNVVAALRRAGIEVDEPVSYAFGKVHKVRVWRIELKR